jgi:hypothetical protein
VPRSRLPCCSLVCCSAYTQQTVKGLHSHDEGWPPQVTLAQHVAMQTVLKAMQTSLTPPV